MTATLLPPTDGRPPVDDPPPSADRPRPSRARSVDDVASFMAAALGSLGFVWVLYERILPFSGGIGFIVCWFATFTVLRAVLVARTNDRPHVIDSVVSSLVHGATSLIGLALVTTVGYVFVKGWPALHHWGFYTHDMAGVRPTAPLSQGGIEHAIVGSVVEVALAVAIALPLGLITAVYMVEVGGRLATTVRTVIEAMTALPDVLAGLFIYTILIIRFGAQRNGLAAGIALAVTMLPVIARSAEVVLKVVPGGLREAGLALGTTHWQTVRRVVLPTARSGLATSLILGIARVTGETAPLLIVSGASTFTNDNPLNGPMNSLPLFIFTAVRSGEPRMIQRGYGAAAVLLTIVLALFSATRLLVRNRAVSAR